MLSVHDGFSTKDGAIARVVYFPVSCNGGRTQRKEEGHRSFLSMALKSSQGVNNRTQKVFHNPSDTTIWAPGVGAGQRIRRHRMDRECGGARD